ncbi:MAG TPA: hypothetical protein VGI60_04565 [Chthoniobacterales bacterium]|jgi:hypothetical protein
MQAPLGDPPAKYVIIFGQSGAPIDLKNRQAFISKLKSASWRRDLIFKPAENGFPSEATNQTVAASTMHARSITQDQVANPNNQQVTQRVGLRGDQKQLMDALLAQVKE